MSTPSEPPPSEEEILNFLNRCERATADRAIYRYWDSRPMTDSAGAWVR